MGLVCGDQKAGSSQLGENLGIKYSRWKEQVQELEVWGEFGLLGKLEEGQGSWPIGMLGTVKMAGKARYYGAKDREQG